MLKVGLVGWGASTGNGGMNFDIARLCPWISKWLCPEHPELGWHEPYIKPISDKVIHCNCLDDTEHYNQFLEGLDAILFIEHTYLRGYDLIGECKKRGIFTVCIPMWEWWPERKPWSLQTDMVWCVTKYTRSYMECLAEYLKYRCDDCSWSKRIYGNYWGIELDDFQFSQRTEVKRFLFVNGNGGGKGLRKGSEVLAAAAAYIPEIEILMLTQNDNYFRPMPDNVKVIGKNFPTKMEVYQNGDVFLAPSHWEGLGHQLYEAQACGLPVVTTDAPPMNECGADWLIPVSKVEPYMLSGKQIPKVTAVHTDIEEDRTIAILKLDEVNLNLNDKKIKFIKLDIEGMEYDALLGALMIIKRDKPLLSIEIKTNQEFYKIYDLLLPLKYSVIGTFNATPTFLFAPEENAGDINALRKTIRELSVYYIQSKTLLKNNPSNVLSESVLSKEKQDQTFVCPLCNYHGIFHDFGYKKRNNALCPNCGSLERTRLLFLFLDKYLDLFKRKMKVIHFAPENNLYKIFMEKIGKLYYPVDIDPELYNKLNMKVDRVDMCSDLDEIYLEKFDIVLHIHVLEHIKCNYRVTLHKIHQLMKPGCVHIIAVPFGGQKTIEDLSPNLIPEERIRRFGHPDHMRSFGEEDFVKVLQEVSGFNNVECDYDKFLTKDDIVKYSLGFDTRGNIPRWNRLFYYIKK